MSDVQSNSIQRTGGVTGRGFQPGRSGNPGGKAKGVVAVTEAARAHTVEAIDRLAFWMRSDKPQASIAASVALLDRAWGKPTQGVEIGGSGTPIEGTLRIEFVKVEQIEGKVG